MDKERKPSQESAVMHAGRIIKDTALGYLSGSHQYIGYPNEAIRFLFEKGFDLAGFKANILHPERIVEAEDALEEGQGVIIVGNHFSKRETLEIYRIPFINPTLRSRDILTPVAEHHKHWHLTFLNLLAHATLQYIPTEETRETYKKEGKTVENASEKMKDYIEKLTDITNEGGISLMFPQGHRQQNLYNTANPHTFSSLYRAVALEERRRTPPGQKPKEPNFSVLFLGFDAPEAENYEELREGTNKDQKYTINIGHTVPIGELLRRAGSARNLDEAIYAELEKYVSPRYLGEGPLQKDSDFRVRLEEHRFEQ